MGTIKVDSEELLRFANQMLDLKSELDTMIKEIGSIEDTVDSIKDVSTYTQKKKLEEMISLAESISREFNDLSEDLNNASKTYSDAKEKIKNSLKAMNDGSFASSLNFGPIPGEDVSIDENEKSEEEIEAEKIQEYKDSIKEIWNLLMANTIFDLDRNEFLIEILDSINDKIETYLESASDIIAEFNEEHPTLSILLYPFEEMAGRLTGTLKFLKNMTIGLVSAVLKGINNEINGLIDDPIKTLIGNGKAAYFIESMAFPFLPDVFGTNEAIANSVWENVKKDFTKKVLNGNAYTVSDYTTEMFLNIGSLFVGAGELKAISSASDVEKAAEGADIAKEAEAATDATKVAEGVMQ